MPSDARSAHKRPPRFPVKVSSAARKAEAPDIPTMVEGGVPGMVATLLTGVVAPAGTPAPIAEKLNGIINADLKTAEMKATLGKFGSEPRVNTPQEFAAFLAGETQKWGAIAKKAGVSVD